MIPLESVHRLLLPLIEAAEFPASLRQRLRDYAELLLVFQPDLPLGTSLGTTQDTSASVRCGESVSREFLRTALIRNLEYWACQPGGMHTRRTHGA
ncbi:hypothetical protein OG735_01170 [Streptomyces sp. NBC_01210]|uniref:hypothetical protein n=1 Tax=Streptomyces sp. NBC_01210 TaxID=2903774 RepID=UPI002E0ED13C|nr:hypothetical protein OG735_01170 [Streptomyces sp. NBC_01210]